jgi:hypothetical protein
MRREHIQRGRSHVNDAIITHTYYMTINMPVKFPQLPAQFFDNQPPTLVNKVFKIITVKV